ncbi:hypothetical protein ACWEQL_00755 [Kitasatospora sp. NPDC004240]
MDHPTRTYQAGAARPPAAPPGRRPIKVMADYDCHPLWFTAAEEAGDVSPEDPRLGLSAGLAADLTAWAGEFDAILVRDDPASSAFTSEEAERRFDTRGRRLAGRVASELGPTWQVLWFEGRTGTVREIPPPGPEPAARR